MLMKFILTAAGAVAFASHALAAVSQAPYTIRATHADFQTQLDDVGMDKGEVGAAARAAARLLAPHNAAQEQMAASLFPNTALSGALRAGGGHNDWQQQTFTIKPELMMALIDLYAEAEYAGRPDVSRLAERLIWHETTDAELLYPAVALASTATQSPYVPHSPATADTRQGPLYGPNPTLMMGIGNPHGAGLLLAAEVHSHTGNQAGALALTLDNGAKWQGDDNMLRGMTAIRESIAPLVPAIHGKTLPAGEYQALSAHIQGQVDFMLANCKLSPEVDEQFHMVLEQVLEGITEMQSGQSPDLGVVRIVSALNAYGDHFQHPGWQRLE